MMMMTTGTDWLRSEHESTYITGGPRLQSYKTSLDLGFIVAQTSQDAQRVLRHRRRAEVARQCHGFSDHPLRLLRLAITC
jgi:hypothetical protein